MDEAREDGPRLDQRRRDPTEAERAGKALVLGAILGVVLALVARRR